MHFLVSVLKHSQFNSKPFLSSVITSIRTASEELQSLPVSQSFLLQLRLYHGLCVHPLHTADRYTADQYDGKPPAVLS
uniref:Uncharacterized protein n=1 Tax=Anguilla anguilla TaxID=7936 RepID=A0A0E9VMB1_ANGAN